MEFLLKEGLL